MCLRIISLTSGFNSRVSALIHSFCGNVLGALPDGEIDDPGLYTAHGVFCGIRAACTYVFGSDDLRNKRVLVQGVGDAGGPLAFKLAEAGASLLVADLDEERAARLAMITEGTVIPVDQVYLTECDVYAPCAVGGTLSSETIPLLKCRIVAGSANNQLRDAADAQRLAERGILYAPD